MMQVWRSMLFVPADNARFIAKAPTSKADAVILDLEDSVLPAAKDAARALLGETIATCASRVPTLVRINSAGRAMVRDLEAAVRPGLAALMVPKVAAPSQLRFVADMLTELETERDLPLGGIGLIGLIEDGDGFSAVEAIACATPRLIGLMIGPEDFCAASSMEPCLETLLGPSQTLALACRRAGVLPFGFPGSIADIADLATLETAVAAAVRLGFVGACCIHPAQVAVLNRIFGVSAAAVTAARRIVDTAREAAANGRGAAMLDGRMIDLPVVRRAEELLARAASYREDHA